MTRLENEPRLTAYALGELDAAEQAEIEAILAADPAAREVVASIRAAADRLSATLGVEPTPVLDDFRRVELTAAIRAPSASARVFAQTAPSTVSFTVSGAKIGPYLVRRWWLTTTAAAAAVALTATGFLLRDSSVDSTRVSEIAASEQPASRPKSVWLLQFHNDSSTGNFVAPSGLETDDDLRVTGATPSTASEPIQSDQQAIQESARKAKVEQLFVAAEELRKQQRFSEAAEAMNQVLAINARDENAKSLVEIYDQGATLFAQREVGAHNRQFTRLQLGARETSIPWAADILYPLNSTQHTAAGNSVTFADGVARTRLESAGQPHLSYGYQVPFGNKKPNHRFKFRGELAESNGADLGYARLGRFQEYAGRQLQSTGYVGGVEVAEERLQASEPARGEARRAFLTLAEGSGAAIPEGFYGPKAPALDGAVVISGDAQDVAHMERVLAELEQRNAAGLRSWAGAMQLAPVLDGDLLQDLGPESTVAEDLIRLHADGALAQEQVNARVAERQRIQEQRRQQKIDQLFGTADELARQARFADAAEAMRQVLYIHPENQNAPQWLRFYEQAQTNPEWRREYEEQVAAETYGPIHHNPFLTASSNPLSTFSIDVDTASYANVRRFLLSGQLPPPAAVRIEECLNYFTYDYPIPDADAPFSANMELAVCPWAPQNRLVRIGLRGWESSDVDRPTANLVFLVDVSGSMQPAERLPLVVQSLKLLVERLRDDDRIALAVYAGASGLALPSTPVRDRAAIVAALDNLSAGGSTNGGEGINLAYNLAAQNFIEGGINRVILCTDGDFNVGIADRNQLQTLIETKAKSGVFLSVLGFGMGNLKDATLETLADRGNGNYAYIDSLDEARKVLVDQMGGTLQTIAKDVKIQVEFNPAAVGAYRLLGYENRMLAAQDFNDDTKDAGEIGAGHTVTALYEIVPVAEMADTHVSAGEAIRAPSASAREFVRTTNKPVGNARNVLRTGVHLEQHPRAGAWGSDIAATLNDVVPPPPSPIDLETETPEILVQDPAIDPLKYQMPDFLVAAHFGGPLELLTLKLRYKEPDGDESRKLEFTLDDAAPAFDDASPDFRFAAAVAGFAMNLRGTPHMAAWPLAAVAESALAAMGPDADRHRAEFLALVKQAQALQAADGR